MNVQFAIQSWYVLAPLFLVLFVYFGAKTFSRKTYSVTRFVLMLTFTLYGLAVLHLVFFPIDVNIGPFANQTPWYKSINYIPILTIDIKTFVYNIVMLVPLGLSLPLLNNRINSTLSAAKFSLYVSLSFEVVQIIMRIMLGNGRSTDINDLIANTIGGAVGFLVYRTLIRVKPIRRLADLSS